MVRTRGSRARAVPDSYPRRSGFLAPFQPTGNAGPAPDLAPPVDPCHVPRAAGGRARVGPGRLQPGSPAREVTMRSRLPAALALLAFAWATAIEGAARHVGVVVGGMLELQLRFAARH